MSSSRTAFVTGGTGFVGSWVVEELLGRGYAVRALVRSDPKWLAEYPVETVRGDLSDAGALRAGVKGADLVVHVAGLTRARDQETLDRANVDGTLTLLQAVEDVAGAQTAGAQTAGAGRVLVTSSLEAMGPNAVRPDGTPVPATEADLLRPISMYGRSKARMEAAVAERYGGLGVTVVRPPAVYGPRETDIFEMVRGAARGLFPIVGDGRAPRLSLVHVRDLARGMVDLVEAGGAAGETYFVGGPAYSWDEVRVAVEGALGRRTLGLPLPPALVGGVGAVAERVGGLVGRLPPLTRDKAVAARYGWTCSSEKAGRAVGYAPRVGLAEGMAETVAWYRGAGWL